jgi:glycosyltransferase involved in cell wall biosynthesis
MEQIKVALVHDWLTGQRGGEKVLEVLAEIFPQAPIFTLFHFKGSQVDNVETKSIRTSFLQKLPFLKRHYRWYLPLFPLAAELFDLSEFDLVVSTSHCVAKGVVPPPHALHISYIHSPVRYAWNQYFAYFSPGQLNVFSRLIIPPLIHRLRIWDESSAQRVDHFVANSKNVARRINKYYRRDSDIIYPPVDAQFFQPAPDRRPGDFYLIVSALVPYKRIDLAIAAFNLTGAPLKIVGDGPDSARDLLRVFQEAKAYLLPGEEDFGITSLEAQACGIPVLALGRGGALETVIPGETGVFFPEASVDSLRQALDKFESFEFNTNTIRANALNFSREIFKAKISAYLDAKWSEFKERK